MGAVFCVNVVAVMKPRRLKIFVEEGGEFFIGHVTYGVDCGAVSFDDEEEGDGLYAEFFSKLRTLIGIN